MSEMSSIPSETKVDSATTMKLGPWRDGKYLVLHPYESRLLRACIKTGEENDLSLDLYELSFTSRDPNYDSFEFKLEPVS